MRAPSLHLRVRSVLLPLALALTLPGLPAQAASRPVQGWDSVILRLDGPLTPTQRRSVAALGGDVYRNLPLIRSVAVRVPRRNRARLTALPFVRHVSPDTLVHKSDEYTVGDTGASVAFQQQGLTGANVAVAVIDSGVRSDRADLGDAAGGSRVVASVDFTTGTAPAEDACGHGTHVAGIVAGNGAASTGAPFTHTYYGIARGADIVSVRVLDAQGQGAVSDVIQGLSWVVQNKDQYHIRVVNLSLGHPVGESYTTDPLCQAAEAAWQAGLVVVCAAGNQGRLTDTPAAPSGGLLRGLLGGLLGSAEPDNEGYGTAYGSIQSPGNDPSVITVGALKQTAWGDDIATYSSRGPSRLDLVLKPDIVAPGNQIISLKAPGSTLDVNYGSSDSVPLSAYTATGSAEASPDYFQLSGTSMAAPVVAGAAALLLEADPTLSPDTVKARLMIGADKPNGGLLNGPDPCTYGAGALDIPAALRCNYTAGQTALSPTLWRDIWGQIHIDSTGLLGGDGSLWGTGLTGLDGVWGSQVIWGENTLSGSQVIWGESVWDNQVIWGESTGGVDLSGTTLWGE